MAECSKGLRIKFFLGTLHSHYNGGRDLWFGRQPSEILSHLCSVVLIFCMVLGGKYKMINTNENRGSKKGQTTHWAPEGRK